MGDAPASASRSSFPGVCPTHAGEVSMVVPVSRGRDQGSGRWSDLPEVPHLVPQSTLYVNLPPGCLAIMSGPLSSQDGERLRGEKGGSSEQYPSEKV